MTRFVGYLFFIAAVAFAVVAVLRYLNDGIIEQDLLVWAVASFVGFVFFLSLAKIERSLRQQKNLLYTQNEQQAQILERMNWLCNHLYSQTTTHNR